MKSALVLCSLVALSAAAVFPPTDLPTTCAVILCTKGTFCREVFNTTRKVVEAQCLDRPMTSLQDNQCKNNSPLLVAAGGDITQANCGSERDAITCPSGFHCIVGFGGAFSVCCRSQVSSEPSQCPAIRPDEVGICASNCRSDDDCKGGDKCCKNPCGSLTCQTPEPKAQPCDTMKCDAGHRCVLQEVRCIRAPCYPVATCIPDCTSGNCSSPKPKPVFPPVGLPSTCASTLCSQGTVCREVLNSGVVQGQCLPPTPVLYNQEVCRDGQPLWVQSGNGPVQATCGRSPDRIDCPTGYTCNIAPNDAYAVCCPSNVIAVTSGSGGSGQKTGQCPQPRLGDFSICTSLCQSDSQCPEKQKCCKNSCGATICQDPAAEKPSCKTVKCSAGFKCELQKPTLCFQNPCYPQPTCVPVKKPGLCPRPRFSFSGCVSQCQTDQDCLGSRKCCKGYFCGKTCENPYRPVRTCATVDCRPGYVCTDKPMPCFVPPCPTRPVCERALSNWPVVQRPAHFKTRSSVLFILKAQSPRVHVAAVEGRCPIYAAFVDPDCFPRDVCQYNDSSSCPRGTLCCSTPCGRQCLKPLE